MRLVQIKFSEIDSSLKDTETLRLERHRRLECTETLRLERHGNTKDMNA